MCGFTTFSPSCDESSIQYGCHIERTYSMEYKLLPIVMCENVAQHLWFDHFSSCVSLNGSEVQQFVARILTILESCFGCFHVVISSHQNSKKHEKSHKPTRVKLTRETLQISTLLDMPSPHVELYPACLLRQLCTRPKPVMLLATLVWRTLTGFREMPEEGYFEELGADRGRNITSPGVDIKGTNEEPLDETGHSKFRRRVDKVQSIFPRRPDALFATKRCSRKLASPTNTDEKKLERLVKWLFTTRSWSFRLVEGWSDTDCAGC